MVSWICLRGTEAMLRAFKRWKENDEDGQAAIELALTLPMLLILVTGMVYYGIAIHNYAVLTDAVAVSARQLAISRGQTTDPCQTVANAVIAAAPSLNSSLMTYTTDIYSGVFHWQYANQTSCSSPNTYSGAAGNLYFNGTVRVTATYPCVFWKYGPSTPTSCVLTASTQEAVQ